MDLAKMTLREKGDSGIFDGVLARKGYALNKMCYSLNQEANRKEFLANEEAYCTKYGLNDEQRSVVRSRDRIDFTVAGGSLYYFAKLARLSPAASAANTYAANLKNGGGN